MPSCIRIKFSTFAVDKSQTVLCIPWCLVPFVGNTNRGTYRELLGDFVRRFTGRHVSPCSIIAVVDNVVALKWKSSIIVSDYHWRSVFSPTCRSKRHRTGQTAPIHPYGWIFSKSISFPVTGWLNLCRCWFKRKRDQGVWRISVIAIVPIACVSTVNAERVRVRSSYSLRKSSETSSVLKILYTSTIDKIVQVGKIKGSIRVGSH